VSESKQELFSRDEFLRLANQAGFRLTEADLAELVRRKLLRGWEPRGARRPQAHFHRLHLFVLTRYFDAVRATRHPWGVVAPSLTLQEIAGKARECRELVNLLVEDGEEASDAGGEQDDAPAMSPDELKMLAEWAAALRERAEELNPFGPLVEFTALMSREALNELRGDGLLYVAFAQMADALEELAPREVVEPQESEPPESEQNVDDRQGQEVEPQPVEEQAVEVQSVEEQSVEEQSVEEREAERQPAEHSAEHSVEQLTTEMQPDVSWADDEVTEFDLSLAERASEDAEPSSEGDAEEKPDADGNEFSRDHSQATARTMDLQNRLARLRSDDEEAARSRGLTPDSSEAVGGDSAEDQSAEEESAEEETIEEESAPQVLVDEVSVEEVEEGDLIEAGEPEEASDPNDGLRARTERLNELRQTYLAEQRWEELAELYEDGLELFVDPTERQQVFLTLALLYEVKLKQLAPAFDRFMAAYGAGGGSQGEQKAFEGMQRLGRQAALQAKWVEFLESQLNDEELSVGGRADLQRHLALALHACGQVQRAFFTYTAFLAEARPEQVDERALDDLEKLASGVDVEALGDFYADLLGHSLPDEVFEPMALRAARHHADCGEVGLAMEYYERVLERLPDHEIAFHSLGQLYEDSARWVRLKGLYEARIKRKGESAGAALRSELERIEELMRAGANSD
jgi:hypothetical protein